MKVGLRVDIDTFRGTKYGVPNLLRLLDEHGITASFFFSVGPDNMGRNIRRLFHPTFLRKMVRTKAANLYGWDIVLRGTFWPGPVIGKRLGSLIRAGSSAGHEIGFHAWDHYAWQAHIDTMSHHIIHSSIKKGVELLTDILGRPPTCSAVPGWKCNDMVLLEKDNFSFDYNSDCRGDSIFRPEVSGKELSQPQIPVTLPTYDEVVGANGVTDNNYNDYIFALLDPRKLNVLTIHAEVEGMINFGLFEDFLKKARSRDISFASLGYLLGRSESIGRSAIVARKIPGREGWVSCQASATFDKRKLEA